MANTLNFDSTPAGMPPEGWTLTKTGQGQPKWTVEADATAPSRPNVLKQSGRAAFPVAIKSDTSIGDGFVEVKFKAIAGSEDRAAGIIWRAKDAWRNVYAWLRRHCSASPWAARAADYLEIAEAKLVDTQQFVEGRTQPEGYLPVCTSVARKTGDTAAAERSSSGPLQAPGAAPLSPSARDRDWEAWPGAASV